MSDHAYVGTKHTRIFVPQGKLLTPPQLAGIDEPIAIYNPSPVLSIDEVPHLWARVEPDTAESYLGRTEIRLFRLHDEGGMTTLEPVVEAPILRGEDPSFFMIGDVYFVGVVKLDDSHQPTTVFYSYDPQVHICIERFRGPAGQKDVRIGQVDPGDLSKGLVVYGRPDFGNDRRRITRTFLTGLDDPQLDEKLATLASEEAVIGEDIFKPFVDSQGREHPTWGGVNYITHIRTSSGAVVRVLGAHYAYFTDTDETTLGGNRPRHYETMLLVDMGDTLIRYCSLGLRGDFPDAPAKAGRKDLEDVCFVGGGTNGQLHGRWVYGLGDNRIGTRMIDYEEAERISRDILEAVLTDTVLSDTVLV